MSAHTKQELEEMLEDVINELDLSESAIEKHGPLATPPAKLVKLVLREKDIKIRILQSNNDSLKTENAKLKEALREVVRISDRKHDAWDKAKSLLQP